MLRGSVGSSSSDVDGCVVWSALVDEGTVFDENEGGARCGWAV